MELSNFRATSLAFERLLRRNDESSLLNCCVPNVQPVNRLSVWGKNGKEREKACSQATNVKIPRGGSRGGTRGPGPARAPSYFQTKLRTEGPTKMFLGDRVPSLSQSLDDRAPAYLKVWIRHCSSSGSPSRKVGDSTQGFLPEGVRELPTFNKCDG